MKTINRLTYCILIISIAVSYTSAGSVTDRDGYKYKTVKIGKQHWMAEDYRFETKYSKCADIHEMNYEDCVREYDYLPTIESGINVCPKGWRLPTVKDFMELTHFVGSDLTITEDATEKQIRRSLRELANRLRSTSCKGGKNTVGFNASCMPDSIGSVYYGQVAGGKNRNVGETAFECFEISGQGISTDCPRGGWSVFLRIRCIEEKP